MKDNKWKKVWLEWDGKGYPPRNVSGAILRSGVFFGGEAVKVLCHFDWLHAPKGYEFGDIVLYSTGQMRRRTKCWNCDGRGNFLISNFWTNDGQVTHKVEGCSTCIGKGYVWEYKDNG